MNKKNPNFKHGMSNSPEFSCWHGMKSRCLNKNSKNYHRYGGRGITICERWLNSFENFYEDMGPKPSPNHSIDRKNNNGNYEPSNCRWATAKEQLDNREITVRTKLNGELLTVSEISDILKMNRHTVYNRIKNDTDLTAPVKQHPSYGTILKYPFNAGMYSVPQIASMTGLKDYNIRHHMAKGMTAQQAVSYILDGEVEDFKNDDIKTLKLYEYKGKNYTVGGLSKHSGLPKNVIADRLFSGMSVHQAVTQPIRVTNKYKFRGEDVTLTDLSLYTGIPRNTLRNYAAVGKLEELTEKKILSLRKILNH
jgi:DNA-binding CsgD family transcriptional regulator